ncbi:integral membrane protein [Plectosphaerella cucumerina]|uniref:Integral membrane protein n=1 Tax=Plectosphaerella cucumerina TaxID=40658 RepID=A0A8K0X5L8_9PEZI|nr:integral membrane protein [Plectosphaerella cucumerina]
MAGETGPLSDPLPINMTIAAFFGVAVYNCLEISVILLDRFKRRNGLYFWAMTVTTAGILLHSIVVLLRYFALGPNFTLAALTCVGWYGMVTGFSVVLYSRLHLVVPDATKIRWVLYLIIGNFFILHVPVTVLFLGANTASTARFIHIFDVYERVQLAGFTAQECLISGIYVVATIRTLRPILAIKLPKERKIVHHLLLVNVFVIILDISLLVTQYTGNFQIQTTYKPVVYSIKLKMEFVILNRLLRLVQRGGYDHWFVLDSSGVQPGSDALSGSFDHGGASSEPSHEIPLYHLPDPVACYSATQGPLRRIQTTPATGIGRAK